MSGGFRRRPWHRYFSDRISGALISPKPSKVVFKVDDVAAELVRFLLDNAELQHSTDQVDRETWTETFGLLKDTAPDLAKTLWTQLSGPDRTLTILRGGPRPRPILARLVTQRDGSFGWERWVPPPALGTAIVEGCDGHDPEDEWVPGSCHHEAGGYFGACYCFPPWSREPAWREPRVDLTELVDVDAMSKERCKEIAHKRRRTIHQAAIDWARAVERGEAKLAPFLSTVDPDWVPWNAGPWWIDGEPVHERRAPPFPSLGTQDTPIGISPASMEKPELLKSEIQIRDREPDYSSESHREALWNPTGPTPCKRCGKTAYPHAWVLEGRNVYHRECCPSVS